MTKLMKEIHGQYDKKNKRIEEIKAKGKSAEEENQNLKEKLEMVVLALIHHFNGCLALQGGRSFVSEWISLKCK